MFVVVRPPYVHGCGWMAAHGLGRCRGSHPTRPVLLERAKAEPHARVAGPADDRPAAGRPDVAIGRVAVKEARGWSDRAAIGVEAPVAVGDRSAPAARAHPHREDASVVE